MAKKPTKIVELDRNAIILGADADTIRAALEAREKIDLLLAERAEAYRKIAELEAQVDEVIGDDAEFPFPEPELPVAEFAPQPKSAKKKPAAKPAAAPKQASASPAATASAAVTPASASDKPASADTAAGSEDDKSARSSGQDGSSAEPESDSDTDEPSRES
ncbi:hypothetical protein H5P28_07615 [Ruficoccus amylovorans]|uniref:Uncharacterized protein n=1 Tax=Ruficoccus amylovorans TaxID=1804625 RepID=A0A842HDK6_9BACT|nr:hypothetical protein [Ruficoccus amylovorans]MBC2594128.1 hypothetical protein [Ruficoccus amylovorans]